jgi:hypothetical protein
MRKVFKTFLTSPSRFIFCLILIPSIVFAANGVMPIDKLRLRLPDGRMIISKRTDYHKHLLILKKGKIIIWQKEYEQEYDRLWDYAFFVPMKKGHFILDINHDGFPEVAIATWDGGNNIADRDALIFTVKPDRLEYYDRRKFNLEYGESAY